MRKIFNKIICFTVAAVAAAGVLSVTGCAPKSIALDGDYSKGEVVSNGGFAVEKGDYLYFINGKESNTADNTYGDVVKGAIMRVKTSDLKAHNYSASYVQTVVPQIAYSGNYNAGLFIYGDYVYYATPSTDKNSDGEVQNSHLAFKSAKLDGTEAMNGAYVQYPDNSIEYRFVEDGEGSEKAVYLLYVATNEKLFGEGSGTKNLHSYNTSTKTDTLLAYNVGDVIFDKSDLTNPRVYYTMNVTDYILGKSYSSKYNQVYTVTASAKREFATGAVDYNKDGYFTKAFEDEEDGYDPDKDPKYVNCGTLVYDGIGVSTPDERTPFNAEGAASVNRSAYIYALTSYEKGNLFYSRRSSAFGSSGSSKLFTVKDNSILSESWKTVEGDTADSGVCLADDSSSSSAYTYLYDEKGDIENVLIANSSGFIRTRLDTDGKILTDVDEQDTFYVTRNGQPTLLFIDYSNNYIYYSVSQNANGYSVNGYSVNRVKYDGECGQYYNPFGESVNDYTPVSVLDLDADKDWYKPEMFCNQILFPTQTANMSAYVYVMACDLSGENNEVLDNEGIKALNDKYKGVSDEIDEIDNTVYENLKNALKYAYFTSDKDYLDELIAAYVKIMDYDEERFWSKQSVEKYKDFVDAKGDWSGYAEDTVNVNGAKVAANKRDYYYSVLGVMSEEDAEAYSNLLKTNYLKEYPEAEQTWFEGLSTGEKVGFIIGVVAGGLIVIAAAVIVSLVIVRKRREKLPSYKKKRIKVDTTDDKDIDVYSDEQ